MQSNQKRRDFLKAGSFGLGAMALNSLLSETNAASENSSPYRAQLPDCTPKAKQIIFLHMLGGPSQMDLFDPKPALAKHAGQTLPDEVLMGRKFAFIGPDAKVISSPYKFRKWGQSGMVMSELLPHMGAIADEFTMVRSMKTDVINHGGAQMFMHTGSGLFGRPSWGSWMSYGLGSENQDLPAFVVLTNGIPAAGSPAWSSGFLPSKHQGVRFRGGKTPVFYLNDPEGVDRQRRGRIVDGVNQMNRLALGRYHDPEIQTRIAQYEMAYRMQASVPELANINDEPEHVLDLYGVKSPREDTFARNCILARRMVERGVRFVQLYHQNWDHHANIYGNLPKSCKQVDQATAALIMDLKQRGLLEDTLIVWGGEFGRTPMAQALAPTGEVQSAPGRDHHIDSFTMLFAGGGMKPGVTYGETDPFGFGVVKDEVHIHDLHATCLHLMGVDHEQLTYRYQGRDFRLTDVHGHIVKGILT